MNGIEIIKIMNKKADTKTRLLVDKIINLVFDNIDIEYEGIDNDFSFHCTESQQTKITIELKKILEGKADEPENKIHIEKFYHRGQKFKYKNRDDEIYILASSYLNRETNKLQCALISMSDGNRWNDAIEVFDVNKITEAEFKQLIGQREIDDFIPVEE